MKKGRIVDAKITPKKTGVEFPTRGLYIQFEVSKTIEIAPNSATITIYNLNKQHRTALLFKYNLFNNKVGDGEISGGKIKLYAGYESEQEGAKLIFDGDIISAVSIRDGGDYITVIKAKTFAETTTTSHVVRTYPAGFGEDNIIKHVLESINFPAIGEELEGYFQQVMTAIQKKDATGKVNKKSKEITFFGAAEQVMSKINKWFQGIFSFNINDGVLNIHAQGIPNKYDKDSGRAIPKWFFSKHTGMIGPPRTTNKGIDLTVLLEPTAKVSDPINIKSDGFGSENPTVVIQAIKHIGDSIDGPFDTELTNFYAVNPNDLIQGLG